MVASAILCVFVSFQQRLLSRMCLSEAQKIWLCVQNPKSERFKHFKAKLPFLICVITLLLHRSPCFGVLNGPVLFPPTLWNLHFPTAASWALTSARLRLQSCITWILNKNYLLLYIFFCNCFGEGREIPCGKLKEGTKKSAGCTQPWRTCAALKVINDNVFSLPPTAYTQFMINIVGSLCTANRTRLKLQVWSSVAG